MTVGVRGPGVGGPRPLVGGFGPPLEPAVVVMQWYGNDFKDDYDFARIRGEVDELDAPPPPPPEPDYGTLAEYSAVYRLIRDWDYKRRHPPGETELRPTVNGREMFVSDSLESHNLAYESVAYGWGETIQALEESRQLVTGEMDAEFVILLIPTKEEAYAQHLTDYLTPAYLDMLAVGRQRLLEVCDERGWRCLDMTPDLQAAVDEGQTVYNAFDFHLDKTGNQVVADTLARYLTENDLLALP